uniref:Uncharacterized protein n=1 Tax=Brassica oleracea var. oleracea TaxID=109376 RepID=A0A0D3BT55_BRAOL
MTREDDKAGAPEDEMVVKEPEVEKKQNWNRRGTYYEEKGDLMSVLMLDEKISPQVMNNSCVSCKCSHRINISGSENSAASDHDPLQQAHPLETTTAHVLPPCGGSTVEELLVLAFECLLKKARNT